MNRGCSVSNQIATKEETMSTNARNNKSGLSRKASHTLSMFVAGALAAGAPAAGAATANYGAGNPNTPLEEFYPTHYHTQRYSYFEQLPPFDPMSPLSPNEMRITFMGSTFPMIHRVAAEMSLFVEVGADEYGNALDSFIFDMGCGANANYTSLGVDFARMNKIFINHLHADHISDLIQVYGFGDGGTRKSPLYVWGSTNTYPYLPNPGTNPPVLPGSPPVQAYPTQPANYNDGVSNMCYHLREAMRWHTESQAFQSSAYTNYPTPAEIQALWNLPHTPTPAGDDPYQDANALIPVELDWTKTGAGLRPDGSGLADNVAYMNTNSRATVYHYPVIHCRRGSMGYKLEWTPPGANKPLTMIYSSDTKPETNSIWQALNIDRNGKTNGVDVFIHEMVMAPELMTMKGAQLPFPPTYTNSSPKFVAYWSNAVYNTWLVEQSSHTPQGAFGYMLSQIDPRPRLAVATHFPVSDDTVACAFRSVQAHCPDIKKMGDKLVWSFDTMVLRVFPDKIIQCRAVGNDYAFATPSSVNFSTVQFYAPKYHTLTGGWDPWAQLDLSAFIPAITTNGAFHYRPDGY
jgi:ribonuclease Z